MRKKIGTICVALALVVGSTSLVYGGNEARNTKVSWLKINGIDYTNADGAGKIKGVTYEAGTNTITLDNCNIVTDASRFIDYVGNIPLNVKIKGNNTITGTESEEEYVMNFLECESDNEDGDASVNVSGGGTLNLNKVGNIVYNYILDESEGSTTNIKDVTINADGGGFLSFSGNLKIENSTIKIDNSNTKGESGIRMGTMLNEYGGRIDIKKSLVEVKVGKYDGRYFRTAIKSRFLQVNGLNIYAGETSAKWKASEKSLLGYIDDKDEAVPNYPTKSTEDYIGYVLITEQKLDLPDISVANDQHTSFNLKGKKTATYFEKGYTGDKVCKICGKIISTGKFVAKKNIKSPTVKSGKKKITIKYKKVSGATRFEIRYKKSGGKWKIKKYAGNKNCSKVIKGLKSSKKYTIQLRVASGKKYSNWSAGKMVKVK